MAKPSAKRARGPSRFRGVWITIAALYFVTVFFDGIGSRLPSKITPRPWLYFAQVAALFTTSAPKVIEYRAEGWSCAARRWIEVDVTPYFRIDSGNKENRFQRALQFYRKNRAVMRALDDYVVRRRSEAGAPIGGVRFSSLRLPYPAPGEHVSPYEPKPLATYPPDQKKEWYWTPKSRRLERCGQSSDGPDMSKDDDSSAPPATGKDPDGELDP